MPVLLMLAAIVSQAAPPAGSADAAQLERIRKALAEAPAVGAPEPGRDGLVFRVTVHAPPPAKPMWDDWANVPSYIRPPMPLYHHEFMEMVTPEEFRASTLYPIGIPVVTLLELLGKRVRLAHRKSEEQHAREEVRQALEALRACRADPSKPGC
jgi:hypothetical protein